jgi:fumarylacetoacetase
VIAAEGSPFSLANLPFGVARGRAHLALGERAIDLVEAAPLLDLDPSIVDGRRLDGLLAAGPATWRGVRAAIQEDPERFEPAMVDRASLHMELPVTIGDYVDGYGGIHHASTCGQIFRPDTDGLTPNYRSVPVAYHGRSGTIVVSGTDIRRPAGQVLVDGAPVLAPTAMLDFELELGVIVGVGNEPGRPIPVDRADEHLFGYVLVNDWSARDVQAWESMPLGPYLGKSFATSISPWVITIDALAPHRVVGLAGEQDPPPLSYLRGDPAVPDLHLSVDVDGERVTDVDLAPSLYWTAAQQLAHATVNGATVRPGDLFASGTISGTDRLTQSGSLLERTWRGTEGRFLQDGDVVVMDGRVGDVGFGGLTGRIVEA